MNVFLAQFCIFELTEAVIETIWSRGLYRRIPQMAGGNPVTFDPHLLECKKSFSSRLGGSKSRITSNRTWRERAKCTETLLVRLYGGVSLDRLERQKARRTGLCQAVEGCNVRASFGRSRNSVPTLCRAHKAIVPLNIVLCRCPYSRRAAACRCLET